MHHALSQGVTLTVIDCVDSEDSDAWVEITYSTDMGLLAKELVPFDLILMDPDEEEPLHVADGRLRVWCLSAN